MHYVPNALNTRTPNSPQTRARKGNALGTIRARSACPGCVLDPATHDRGRGVEGRRIDREQWWQLKIPPFELGPDLTKGGIFSWQYSDSSFQPLGTYRGGLVYIRISVCIVFSKFRKFSVYTLVYILFLIEFGRDFKNGLVYIPIYILVYPCSAKRSQGGGHSGIPLFRNCPL